MAVLDKMIDPVEGQPGLYTVYYHILDGDRDGHSPCCQSFNDAEKSCLYKIAENDNKVISCIFVILSYVVCILNISEGDGLS